MKNLAIFNLEFIFLFWFFYKNYDKASIAIFALFC